MKREKAFTLMELAVVASIFLLMLMALAPFVQMARTRAHRINCANNLKKLSLGLHAYAADHNDVFPETLGGLYPSYAEDRALFDCPASKSPGTKESPDYVYAAGLTESSSPKEIIVQDIDGNHRKAGKNILRVNGSVEWVGTRR